MQWTVEKALRPRRLFETRDARMPPVCRHWSVPTKGWAEAGPRLLVRGRWPHAGQAFCPGEGKEIQPQQGPRRGRQ